ncbi:MAG: flavodoxin-dependent (E)-4-hydroxy-3-methylbut-2-enyl-diphosphate synthase [Syntrophomonadaceae bacterium]|jgi:(E)-4-hydroxy-3-methylbut-2-enyl-diphosphate synthase|nr:flavodoxin-dependent (E)-4-hydroxy-3-methylbut-2-enyl-diphosphate synthase [Bacillota bacterium]NLM88244.1 flavodoxin-dependent (E)-4-hydroxy-3-methylbut-2-enyl-diphosphate synthase [Syntrophomonadaceae bacterium]HAA08866.1 4-hydroxy-3-methylbut-2-en-1-yl diphosphate synthase [Syntrophomonas sp.]HQA49222.1 flavodoxin-dependent (E)-4-hydroxy-3-methylbut-2-enyl-diphosphate synthase [Syntrophomonadaceae bacterium]HQD89414.1 flavodoxin-dependent (E)-4-hydroxy-3-methylbut-2-enyl-diphosphate synth
MRRKTRVIKIGDVRIGGEHPIVVQSMTNTDTRNVEATVRQIQQLETVGCEIVRVAVPDEEAAGAIAKIVPQINIPLIADIHFDYRLALKSIAAGAQGLRINPGNIGERKRVQEVVRQCQERGIPIRIGVNAGSLERSLLTKYGKASAPAMVESALEHIKILEDMGFTDIKISMKSSSVLMTVNAYQMLSQQVDYPLHVGITEAGTLERGLLKSAVGLGLLLYQGIGDTIRVSLTADPVEEVWAAYEILRNLELRQRGVELISCPTCGRCEIDLINLAQSVEEKVKFIPEPIKIAVMGCVVNGPGEARDADIGVAGGRGVGLLFRNGEIIKKVPQTQLIDELMAEIYKQCGQGGTGQ